MNVRLTFSRPTTNNDGSPLAAADILQYDVAGTVTIPLGTVFTADVAPAIIGGSLEDATLNVVNAAAGDTVCLTLRTRTFDAASDPSAPACVLGATRPNPPNNLVLSNA